MSDSTVIVSDALKQQLAQQIERGLQDSPQAMGADEIRQGFCQAWPSAKTGLEALRVVLNLVPGVNVFAGPAISLVLTAGDAAQGAVCK